MKPLFFIILCLLISHVSFAQKNQQHIVDSLTTIIENTTGTKKLNAITLLARYKVLSPQYLSILDDLDDEAIIQERYDILLHSYQSRINYYTMHYNQDSINKYIDLAESIVNKVDPRSSIIATYETIKVITYTNRGLFDLALLNQKRYLEKLKKTDNSAQNKNLLFGIYASIGDIYYQQGKYENALEYFKKVDEIGLARYNSAEDPITRITILYLVGLCHLKMGDYEKAIGNYHLICEILNDKQGLIADESFSFLDLLSKLLGVQVYLKTKDFEKVKDLIEKLPQNPDQSLLQGEDADYYNVLLSYYTETEEYDKALMYTNLAIASFNKTKKIIGLPAFHKEKAIIQYRMHNYKEAYDELSYATHMEDSIRRSNSTIQLDALATMYDVELKNAEIAKTKSQLRENQSITIASVVVAVLSLILLFGFRVHAKRQQKKNKILFKQHEEMYRSIDYYKRIMGDAGNQHKEEETNPLFLKLEKYISEEEEYKNPDINRDYIATILNTNRQYLATAIKDATGLTFTEYINKHRLEYAWKLLIEDTMTIDSIVIAAGFSSRSTFHRLFKEKYGMPPHELKVIALAHQKEIKDKES